MNEELHLSLSSKVYDGLNFIQEYLLCTLERLKRGYLAPTSGADLFLIPDEDGS